MSTELARIPDRVLPAPGRGDLPEPVALRRMIGPSIILAGLSIGSGEFVLWPRLTAEFGFAVFWACWIGVTIQFFLNMEIERWTLLTGESAVVGFIRLSRGFGPISSLRNLAVSPDMAAVSSLDLGPNSGPWLGQGL